MFNRSLPRAMLILLGFLQALAGRYWMEPDGVNYLDAARAYLRHDWHLALNGWWSPLYSWLLALSLLLVRPSPRLESTVLHLLNFLVFLAALLSFEVFLKEATRESSSPNHDTVGGFSTDLVYLLGYTLFAFSSLFLITLRLDTPDLCVASVVFLAFALVLRIRSNEASLVTYLLLGFVLAIGYFAKTAMFPLAFSFLVSAWLGVPPRPKHLLHVLAATVLFLGLSSPLIYFLSIRAAHPTFGEIGRMAYAVYVNGVPDPVAWQAGVPGTGHPLHPMTVSSTSPPVYVYTQPFEASYPPWYDSSYWFAGVTPHFELRGQIRALRLNLSSYYLEFSTRREFLVGFLALFLVSGAWFTALKGIFHQWPIWIPTLAAFSMYAFVHADTRFLGAFFALFWFAAFLGLREACKDVPTRFVSSIVGVIAFMVAITCLDGALGDAISLSRGPIHEQWEVAEALRHAGLSPGERVAIIGHSNTADYWAHLADLRIVAEVTQEGAPVFWQATPEGKARVMEEFRMAGAKAVVTLFSSAQSTTGWIRLGRSSYYVLLFESGGSMTPRPENKPTPVP